MRHDYPEEIYNDEAITVINKPAGWVVHVGAGETGETIVDWFIKNYPKVAGENWEDKTRPGIVHRLDKNTSGVMVLAKTPEALANLQQQFKARTTKKFYEALVFGKMPHIQSGVIETFIGRHPKRRQEQAVLPVQVGEAARREAITEYWVEKTFALPNREIVSLIQFYPHTGRMHQLRVHAKHVGAPILGDPTYNTKPSKRFSKVWEIDRQLLHAQRLIFEHPTTHKIVKFEAPLPDDFEHSLQRLERNSRAA